MFARVLLRDVPKYEVQIDRWRQPIQGGFRGVMRIPPAPHYFAIFDSGKQYGFWHLLMPHEVLIRRYEPGVGFVKDDPETEAQYRGMAQSGAMDRALIRYPLDRVGDWIPLTSYQKVGRFPPTVHAEDPPGDALTSRLERALRLTHRGNGKALLAEFQFAFLRWIVDADDTAARDRWLHLLQASYNAGESLIREEATFFQSLIRLIAQQLDALPVGGGDALTMHGSYLVEDAHDTGIDALGKAADLLTASLARMAGK